MTQVILDMAISLDGCIAGPDGADAGLHNWYFDPPPNSRAIIDELITGLGAIIMGRRTYQTGADADGFVDNPYNAAHFILTHHGPDQLPRGATPFTFVTDGIESALAQARIAAGDRDIAIGGGADVARQYLSAGLIDMIQLHIVPVIIGGGLRLFDTPIASTPTLDITRVVVSSGVTHIQYRVNR
jgi:dihydrofolate reductase